MKCILSYYIIILILLSCNPKKGSNIVDGYKVIGEINNDSTFEGIIKFYDTSSGLIAREALYTHGILNGQVKEYNKTGNILSVSNYENNRLNGTVSIFDVKGNLIKSDFYFYDLRVGPSITFKMNEPITYNFNSLEGDVLLSINYDSLDLLQTLKDGCFFYKFYLYDEVLQDGSKTNIKELFLYTPNPPKYNFKYSIIELDSNGLEAKELYIYDNKTPWSVYSLPSSGVGKLKLYAIKLVVSSTSSKRDIVLLKKL
jgi:hypothetical protein